MLKIHENRKNSRYVLSGLKGAPRSQPQFQAEISNSVTLCIPPMARMNEANATG
jgi:CBS-domain-containing membrane protein